MVPKSTCKTKTIGRGWSWKGEDPTFRFSFRTFIGYFSGNFSNNLLNIWFRFDSPWQHRHANWALCIIHLCFCINNHVTKTVTMSQPIPYSTSTCNTSFNVTSLYLWQFSLTLVYVHPAKKYLNFVVSSES